ncbi:MAG: hypothetical protein PHX58_01760 [Desulfovibrio sp.]|nr:hypothetical protein [Desulfovibrio sp.]
MRLHILIIACVLTLAWGAGYVASAEEQSGSGAASDSQAPQTVEADPGGGVAEIDTGDASQAPDTPQPSAAELAALQKKEEEQLRMHADFARFSDTWVARLNRSHSNGYTNMRFIQDGDVVRARYHRIEKRSSVVRESPSRPGQYCGILRYQDTLYECVGPSAEDCAGGEFIPVSGTARAFSEIFQFKNGVWR